MAVSSPALHDALARVVGADRFDATPRPADAIDGVLPRFIARPQNVEALSALLTLASAERLAVVPKGSGSSLALGNPPRRLDMIIDLAGLSAIVEHVPDDLVATVGAGHSLAALNASLGKRRQMLALDPVGGAARTLGGILATNASGPLRFRYGTGRDMLLGVRFVQADGTITWGGAKVVKSVTGYDVPKLLVGSLGTLGIIAEATLRLHPMPPARATASLTCRSADAARDVLAAVLGSSLEPERLTLLSAGAAERAGGGSDGFVVLVSFGSVKEAVDSQIEALRPIAAAHEATFDLVGESVWEALHTALDDGIVLSSRCEPTRALATACELDQRARRVGMRASVVAQPGSGVLECALSGAPPAPDVFDRQLLAPLRELLVSHGGSVVVQKAPLAMKERLDPWGPIAPGAFALMERLKRDLDPIGVLSPGRFVGGL